MTAWKEERILGKKAEMSISELVSKYLRSMLTELIKSHPFYLQKQIEELRRQVRGLSRTKLPEEDSNRDDIAIQYLRRGGLFSPTVQSDNLVDLSPQDQTKHVFSPGKTSGGTL